MGADCQVLFEKSPVLSPGTDGPKGFLGAPRFLPEHALGSQYFKKYIPDCSGIHSPARAREKAMQQYTGKYQP